MWPKSPLQMWTQHPVFPILLPMMVQSLMNGNLIAIPLKLMGARPGRRVPCLGSSCVGIRASNHSKYPYFFVLHLFGAVPKDVFTALPPHSDPACGWFPTTCMWKERGIQCPSPRAVKLWGTIWGGMPTHKCAGDSTEAWQWHGI